MMEAIVNILLAKGWTPGATGIWVIALMLGGWLMREWRATRKLSIEDRQARREGYEKQVQELLKENRELRKEVGTVRAEARVELAEVQASFDDYRRLCRLETDQLRTQIMELQDTLQGLKREDAGLATARSRIITRDSQL